jgi:aspartate carbamoyltransferase catalytic subunit
MLFNHKDFISTRDLSREEIFEILDIAKHMKEISKREVKKVPTLKGKTISTAFFEPSTRTRTSFEIAAKRLSADTVSFTSTASSTTKGETLLDTIKNIENMHTDIFVIRHKCSGAVKFVADNVKAHIVNAGDGTNEHPTQAMLDLFTIREHKNILEGLNVSIIGDIEHSRVARSNIWAMQKLGINITLFAPKTVIPSNIIPFKCSIAKNFKEAISNADVVMMLRIQLERQNKILIPSLREYAMFFGLNQKSGKHLKKDAIIMHPGPINRGVELSTEYADCDRSVILNQVENGIAIRMAILYLLGTQKRRTDGSST